MLDKETMQWVSQCNRAGLNVVNSEYISTKYGLAQCIKVEIQVNTKEEAENYRSFTKWYANNEYMMLLEDMGEGKHVISWVPHRLMQKAMESAEDLSWQLRETTAYLQEDALCLKLYNVLRELDMDLQNLWYQKQEERLNEEFRTVQNRFKVCYLFLKDEEWYHKLLEENEKADSDMERVTDLMVFV